MCKYYFIESLDPYLPLKDLDCFLTMFWDVICSVTYRFKIFDKETLTLILFLQVRMMKISNNRITRLGHPI